MMGGPMMWHAIFGPDGEVLAVCPVSRNAWLCALEEVLGRVEITSPLYREWYKHDAQWESVAACEALGYRRADVEVVPRAKMDAIRLAVSLWGLSLDRLEEWANNPLHTKKPGNPT